LRLFSDIDLNVKYISGAFEGCGDVVSRKFKTGGNWAYLCYLDNMADKNVLERSVMARLMKRPPSGDLFTSALEGVISTADARAEEDADACVAAVMSGEAALLLDNSDKAIIIAAKAAPNRGVGTAENEVVVFGPKDAFTETLRFNTVMIRRRVRDPGLKVTQMKAGRRSKTDIAVMYIDGIARRDIADEAIRRIKAIDIDAVPDAAFLSQLIEDDEYSPFPQILITERPDRAAASLMDGRVVIAADNSPACLVLPATAASFFASPEDYYQKPDIMSFTRVLRYIAALIAAGLPGLYIAATLFHPDIVPFAWALKMAAAQREVPFPTVIEVLVMEFAFELLREAGVRLPHPVGGAIGIVGGLIVGQAAVEAGIVSPVVVIVTALTGIAGFAVPGYQLGASLRLVKYIAILASAFLGLFGFWASLLFTGVHLASLSSFGVPYMYPIAASGIGGYGEMGDSILRFPIKWLRRRPFSARPDNRVKQGGHDVIRKP
jgi:spore germination protein